MSAPRTVGGPFFDELEVGQVFDTAPSLTLTEGRAAQHQVIAGDRWRLALDDHLAHSVAGGAVASPALVTNAAIGQTTLVTQRVRANLFYRRFALLRQPLIGDTLGTTTTVVGLRENGRREGRPPTGLAALHMRTVDQHGRPVVDFYRCAMLPLSPGAPPTGHADDLDAVGADLPPVDPTVLVPAWDRSAYVAGGVREVVPQEGDVLEVATGDVVSSAPELARLTLNVAAVHHDRFQAGGQRLVYGGHTIAIATSQLLRALPDLATILAWESCDHTGPVHEGDTLTSRFTVGRVTAVGDWSVVDLRAEVAANGERPVLDWRFSVLA
ncbi:acyl dehydratase [Nocardioides sp. J9]|uniref:acyl dehydratase n=1 Tax=Nocardioides sp. J9 TaxID=935844 RepID=UPI0011AB2AC2|nr:acyl dehydratase [Nocardioides sp. J9]TWG94935.1 acyl dehydratase [Nocardioides sp. J9]